MTSPLERLGQEGENHRQIGPHKTVFAPNVAFKFQRFKFTRFLVINELKNLQNKNGHFYSFVVLEFCGQRVLILILAKSFNFRVS